MRIGLLETPGARALRNRIEALNMPVSVLDPLLVQELTADSVDLVYLIPFDGLSGRIWNSVRVKLAQATRQFIIAGAGLRSADLIAAVREGASDVLDESDDDERWRAALTRAGDSQRVWIQLYGGATASIQEVLSGRSSVIRAIRQTIKKLGPTDVNVLILGESGAGKERVARAIHQASRRRGFVALNCAAIPKDLLETELFGVEKGAFTGASRSRPGLVEQASGGTLFLDEIGELDLALQPKLLRFLETRTARRVGSEQEYNSKARIVAATNRDLLADGKTGQFRSDLYYRLAEITLTVPPLRERPEDIPGLVEVFLRLACERFGKNIECVEPGLLQQMQTYHWTGNARELKSVIDRLVLLYEGPMLRQGWWEPPSRPISSPTVARVSAVSGEVNLVLSRKQKQERAGRLLAESGNNYTWVAAQLGINTSTLWRWRKAGIG
jgi:DNA-binding NtrC family response regulator